MGHYAGEMDGSPGPNHKTPMEKDRDERIAQLTGYRRKKAAELEELCHGQHGKEITELAKMLKTLTINSAGALAATVLSARWLASADAEIRAAVLSMVGDAIIKVRIRAGLSPFDDSLGDETPTVFQVLRQHLTGV